MVDEPIRDEGMGPRNGEIVDMSARRGYVRDLEEQELVVEQNLQGLQG